MDKIYLNKKNLYIYKKIQKLYNNEKTNNFENIDNIYNIKKLYDSMNKINNFTGGYYNISECYYSGLNKDECKNLLTMIDELLQYIKKKKKK